MQKGEADTRSKYRISLQQEEFGKLKLINARYSREGDFKSYVQTFASPW